MSSLLATDPAHNATVSASAGSGKTWLLVTRIIRLLIEGNPAGHILALTFTRKAATEMNMRLSERLLGLATADDRDLDALLEQIGLTAEPTLRRRARRLYEELLSSDYPIRIQTFHSFCQDILSRFAMEADVPPGFQLIEDTSLIAQQAWEKLIDIATHYPDGSISDHLDTLMAFTNGPFNANAALMRMLDHRTDWWAFTEDQSDAIEHAMDTLGTQLDIEPGSDDYTSDFFGRHQEALYEFHELLGRHPNKTNSGHQAQLAEALESLPYTISTLSAVADVFLTKSGPPRKREDNPTLRNKMGDDGAERFLALHGQLCTAIGTCLDIHKRHRTLQVNTSWYALGDALIREYQNIKRMRRVLDFGDLEWHCYRLLSAEDNASWVQYKLDQKIDHILIDEFQDTNPTQWALLSPLIEEMAASHGDSAMAERARSVFLVGDEKQSIYSFRRANPALQSKVSTQLRQQMSAVPVPMTDSRRSAPAIMAFVNAVFEQPEIAAVMSDFPHHDTHLGALGGSVTLLPAFVDDEDSEETTGFRDPLEQPRILPQKDARVQEAVCIAGEITSLMERGDVGDYADIMILIRNRTHLQTYEEALQQAGIPFLSDRKGGLLDNLEIQDMERLLDVLITPFDDLALAQVLRSPMFDASAHDLLLLADLKEHPYWYQRLQALGPESQTDSPLAIAANKLQAWRRLADRLPVHDLLEHISADIGLVERYSRKAPALARQIRANLRRFIELALDVESGRYPSLGQFKHYLSQMREFASDQLGLPDDGDARKRVRVMTIHGSKGLESQVVFLADTNWSIKDRNAWSALVDWPEDSDRPTAFQLQLGREHLDSITANLIDTRSAAQYREELNLLYVALTRARRHLYLSAIAADKGWYANLQAAMLTLTGDPETHVHRFEGSTDEAGPSAPESPRPSDRRLVLADRDSSIRTSTERLIAPSKLEHEDSPITAEGDAKARLRGTVIHRCLEHFRGSSLDTPVLRERLRHEFGTALDDALLDDCMDEAAALTTSSAMTQIFSPTQDQRVFNELPVLYQHGEEKVFGIIDRVIVDAEEVLLIDYKTHRVQPDQAEALAKTFAEQLKYYEVAAAGLWQGRSVRSGVVFTHTRQLIWL